MNMLGKSIAAALISTLHLHKTAYGRGYTTYEDRGLYPSRHPGRCSSKGYMIETGVPPAYHIGTTVLERCGNSKLAC